ncbi:hypothetical protein, partial [Romboutsia sp.]|uniref:hypothetical protein n=1 Tax=Romboutsia sp. TaxID=1965302 RepID=UPI002CCCA193
NISQLLEALKDPSVNLTVGEKLLAGFSVAILSMTVVFIVLVIISAITSLLQREKQVLNWIIEYNVKNAGKIIFLAFFMLHRLII